jgi:hypothetical protein
MKYWIIAICVTIVLTVVGLFFFHPRSPLNRTDGVAPVAVQQVPAAELSLPLVDLEGDWHAVANGIRFEAEVTGSIIKINMYTESGLEALYWFGSFHNSEEAGKTITSEADDSRVALSSDKTKIFEVDKTTLTFEFQAMGIKKSVVMKRG